MKKYISVVCILAVVISALFTATISASAGSDNLLLGDATVDTKVNVKDATAIQKHVAGIALLTADGILVADVDGNNSVNIKDATAIQKFVAGMDIEFRIGEPIGSAGKPDSTEPSTGVAPTEPSAEPEPTNPETPSVINEFSPTDTNEDDAVTAEMLAKIEAGFFRLVNEERVKNGLAPLTYNKHLDDVAQMRSAEIKVSYSHTRPNGTSWATLVDTNKYHCKNLGENLSYESQLIDGLYDPTEDFFTGSDELIELIYTKIFTDFKNSEVHYTNMMHETFENTGIGIDVKYKAGIDIPFFYVSQIFGSEF